MREQNHKYEIVQTVNTVKNAGHHVLSVDIGEAVF